ncbi:MAG TPA: hypothetical protein PK177_10075 [Burkholderiaceae bacterium]|nr:hypothetical protein [Burkholderiaceae bacterium]
MSAVEMRSMMLPLTSTFDGADSELPLPSKMRTFWNSVSAEAPSAACPRTSGACAAAATSSAAATVSRIDPFMSTRLRCSLDWSVQHIPLPGSSPDLSRAPGAAAANAASRPAATLRRSPNRLNEILFALWP